MPQPDRVRESSTIDRQRRPAQRTRPASAFVERILNAKKGHREERRGEETGTGYLGEGALDSHTRAIFTPVYGTVTVGFSVSRAVVGEHLTCE